MSRDEWCARYTTHQALYHYAWITKTDSNEALMEASSKIPTRDLNVLIHTVKKHLPVSQRVAKIHTIINSPPEKGARVCRAYLLIFTHARRELIELFNFLFMLIKLRDRVYLSAEEVWFSHLENKWIVHNGKFQWIEEKQICDWEGCKVGLTRTAEENKLRAVIRRAR
jgi:hypothetical protein